MRILITAWRSDLYGGMETYTRDLALGLQRRGHTAAVVNEGFHRTARSMASEGVRVCRDWDEIGFVPDIIHGQSAVDTVTALCRFPSAPALYQCHSAGVLSAPPMHPRIYRYAGTAPTFTQRLVIEFGIPEDTTDVVLNSVDLTRFVTVRSAPSKPTRALFYNSYHPPGSRTFETVRQAVEACGLEFDCIGRPFRNTIERPEDVLPEYDIVFACGRSAIEALASGCAVVVLSMTSCGDMVRRSNFDRFRRANFAIPFNSLPPSVDRIMSEIAGYNADDCAAVTERLRGEADATETIVQIEEIYLKVLAAHRAAVRNGEADERAVARYLRWMCTVVKLIDEVRAHGAMPLTRGAASGSLSAQLADAATKSRPVTDSRTFL